MAFFKLIDLFKNYPKVNNFLGYFWVRICCQELSKIAQSGHTEVDFSFECKNLKTFWLLANAKTWREREKENFQSWLNLAILFATFMVKSSHSLNKYVDRGGGEFVHAYHHMVPGSNPEHTSHAFYSQILSLW